jgi:hypothetical protein
MSTVKFSFEGDVATLLRMLKGLGLDDEPQEGLVHRTVPDPPTMEPLDPVYGDPGPGGAYGQNLVESSPAPTAYPPTAPAVQEGFDFGNLPLDPDAWQEFTLFVMKWAQNFDASPDEEGNPAEQPDRLALLKELGSGRWSIYVLRWLAHYRSLQGGVYHALAGCPVEGAALIDLVDRISANIAQVAHAAFPDIADFHDYSTKWKRDLQEPS